MRPAGGCWFQHNELEFSATRMSALGQKQTLGKVRLMSALPPKADIGTQPRNVCFVPIADILQRGKERRYSITLSARSSNDSGIVKPSALAVVRLMTKSYLVGCSTGMSAGFAPRRILSVISAARRKRS